MRSPTGALVAMALVAASCGGGTGSTTTTAAPPTTTTTVVPTTTTQPPASFDSDDLAAAVHTNDDPWPVAMTGVEPFEITLDDIWPPAEFPEGRAIYEEAGFTDATIAFFVEDVAILISAAHLFEDAEGALMAFDLIEESFRDVELVASITALAPGSLDTVDTLESDFGDRSVAVRISGPEFQVVGIIWVTGNMLQFVRAGMVAGDDARAAAAFDVAAEMEARTGR